MSRLRPRDRAIIGLLSFFLVIAFTFELWLLLSPDGGLVDRARSGDVIARLLSIYGEADRGFYSRPTPFILGLESINVFFTQILNVWLILAILRNKPYRHVLQLAV